MGYAELGILAVALAVDAFSVAAAVGPSICPRWGAARLAASFGLFQAGMPLLGALAGAFLFEYIRSYDHWVAFGLLELVGAKMIVDAFWRGRAGAEEADASGTAATGDARPAGADPSCGLSLLGLSVATSIDAFGAGVMLRLAGASLWASSLVIGLTAAALTYAGARLGTRAERVLGRKAEIGGGLVLIALGFRMLFTI